MASLQRLIWGVVNRSMQSTYMSELRFWRPPKPRDHQHPGDTCTVVGPTEQVAHCLPAEQRAPPPPLMLRPVVDHVAPLAEGREVAVRIVGRVVVSMGRGQNDTSPANTAEDIGPRRDPDPASPPITPPASLSVPPATIAEVVDHPPVR